LSFEVYLDENVDVELAALLAGDGFDALTARAADRANRNVSDSDQLEFAASHGRAIVTHDIRDFDALAKTWAESDRRHSGIIFSRPRPAPALYQGLLILFAQYPRGIADLTLWLPRAPA
jgi:hypothetical protein